jgi:succinate dehydrogenase/fumarate reductase-like Fe-S protein
MTLLNKKWCFAQLNLAYRLFLHLLKWPFSRFFKKGQKQFFQNYAAELNWVPNIEFAALSHEPSRCMACGLCDAVCPLIGANFTGPMQLVLGVMQGGERLKAAKAELSVLSDSACADCRACDKACPVQIPITTLAKHYANGLGDAQSL